MRGRGIPYRTLENVPDYLNSQLCNWCVPTCNRSLVLVYACVLKICPIAVKAASRKKSTVNPEKYSQLDARCLKYKTLCALELEQLEYDLFHITVSTQGLVLLPNSVYTCGVQ
eukprot:560547-Prorocentrum_minimum.AAC.5